MLRDEQFVRVVMVLRKGTPGGEGAHDYLIVRLTPLFCLAEINVLFQALKPTHIFAYVGDSSDPDFYWAHPPSTEIEWC